MTRVNDYLWQLPHTPEANDPPDVITLVQQFNTPLADTLRDPLTELGYELRSNDIMVPPDKMVMIEDMGDLANTYKANVRFIKYLSGDVITRVHFEHQEWSAGLARQYIISLDRFKVEDRATMRVEPAWEGRLHTLVSSLPGDLLHFTGADQFWTYESTPELLAGIELFLEKFTKNGQRWLEESASV